MPSPLPRFVFGRRQGCEVGQRSDPRFLPGRVASTAQGACSVLPSCHRLLSTSHARAAVFGSISVGIESWCTPWWMRSLLHAFVYAHSCVCVCVVHDATLSLACTAISDMVYSPQALAFHNCVACCLPSRSVMPAEQMSSMLQAFSNMVARQKQHQHHKQQMPQKLLQLVGNQTGGRKASEGKLCACCLVQIARPVGLHKVRRETRHNGCSHHVAVSWERRGFEGDISQVAVGVDSGERPCTSTPRLRTGERRDRSHMSLGAMTWSSLPNARNTCGPWQFSGRRHTKKQLVH